MSHHDTIRPTVQLDSSQTGDAIGVIEVAAPPMWDGPPLHHHDFDETFYVLDGALTFQLGDEVVTRGPGSVTFAPRGSNHTVANMSEEPARYLLVCTPGGFERMFSRMAARAAGAEPTEEAMKPYPETTMVGPTLFERMGSSS
jgi:mannose-6-phosphate isomerase-like protein (cupin superfamily)